MSVIEIVSQMIPVQKKKLCQARKKYLPEKTNKVPFSAIFQIFCFFTQIRKKYVIFVILFTQIRKKYVIFVMPTKNKVICDSESIYL